MSAKNTHVEIVRLREQHAKLSETLSAKRKELEPYGLQLFQVLQKYKFFPEGFDVYQGVYVEDVLEPKYIQIQVSRKEIKEYTRDIKVFSIPPHWFFSEGDDYLKEVVAKVEGDKEVSKIREQIDKKNIELDELRTKLDKARTNARLKNIVT